MESLSLGNNKDIVYGLFGSLFIGAFLLLAIGYFTLRIALWLVNRPKQYVLAVIYVLIFSGAYSLEHSLFEPTVVLVMGVIGYIMKYIGFSVLPMVLGVVLGFMVETNFRRCMVISGGDLSIFIKDPISLILLSFSCAFILYSLLSSFGVKFSRSK